MTFSDFGIKVTGTGEQRTTCPQCSPKRKKKNDPCLAVNVEQGIWYCWHCGWSGGLIQAKEREIFIPTIVKTQALPASDKVIEYFNSRCISKEVVRRNKVSNERVFMSATGKEENCIAFNYFYRGNIVNCKYRSAFKDFQQIKGGSKILYKIDDIETTDEAIITEGEIDALSFEEAGFRNAVSIPDGSLNPDAKNVTAKMKFLDNCYDYFENKKKIYLALDSDDSGQRMTEELARRLGKERCLIVKFPAGCKDANEVLQKHGKEVLRGLISKADYYPLEGVKKASDYAGLVYSLFKNGYPNGARTGYLGFDNLIKWYPGQITVVSGIPGHGKSNFVDEIILCLSESAGWTWGVFSPEHEPHIHMERLVAMQAQKPFLPAFKTQMSDDEFFKSSQFIDEHINFIMPDNENYALEKILESTESLVRQKGINGLIIDPWNTIEHQYGKESEHTYTGKILNKLKFFSRKNGIHTIIVAHPRKMAKRFKSRNYEIPTLYDISGSSNWYNIADNGICIYREFTKDQKDSETKVFVQKVKHKFIGKQGEAKFKFDSSCYRFRPLYPDFTTAGEDNPNF